jgi:hypothetical protein
VASSSTFERCTDPPSPSCSAGSTPLVGPTGIAALAVVFAKYLGRLVGLSAVGVRFAAAGAIVIVAAASYRPVRSASAMKGAATLGKVAALAAIVVTALLLGDGSAGEEQESRVIAGIHFRFAIEAGHSLGQDIGRYTAKTRLQQRGCATEVRRGGHVITSTRAVHVVGEIVGQNQHGICPSNHESKKGRSRVFYSIAMELAVLSLPLRLESGSEESWFEPRRGNWKAG